MTLRFGLLVFPNVQLLDFAGPYDAFASVAGAEVHVVAQTLDPLRCSNGLVFHPTAAFETCPQLDVLCVAGGGGVNASLVNPAVLGFIREQAAGARYVTSVCTGSLLLGAAGLLKGKRATTHWNALDFLKNFGAEASRDRVVQDGNLITAGGVTSGIDFGLTVIGEVLGQKEAETVQLSIEYAPQPPFNSGIPATASPEVLEAAKQRLLSSRKLREEILSAWV
ncbi:DJ-1/PfpI family protein [Roseibium litorale]|uniref:DJ-1/PfpI family protein n=1 Tax=Roseibium litorale TaxID=2803841 RepID=A0ABR9CPF4_9HYPH|nr:DJ-1/PfpI family protein [Roseibium litorale]MBD8892167.1 DJ-1/PfpI family protein [Roseibium litorale]